jgi:hypothetical protein
VANAPVRPSKWRIVVEMALVVTTILSLYFAWKNSRRALAAEARAEVAEAAAAEERKQNADLRKALDNCLGLQRGTRAVDR